MECKYWLIIEEFEIKEAYFYNGSPSAKREVKRIIYEHFDLIVAEWNRFFK